MSWLMEDQNLQPENRAQQTTLLKPTTQVAQFHHDTEFNYQTGEYGCAEHYTVTPEGLQLLHDHNLPLKYARFLPPCYYTKNIIENKPQEPLSSERAPVRSSTKKGITSVISTIVNKLSDIGIKIPYLTGSFHVDLYTDNLIITQSLDLKPHNNLIYMQKNDLTISTNAADYIESADQLNEAAHNATSTKKVNKTESDESDTQKPTKKRAPRIRRSLNVQSQQVIDEVASSAEDLSESSSETINNVQTDLEGTLEESLSGAEIEATANSDTEEQKAKNIQGSDFNKKLNNILVSQKANKDELIYNQIQYELKKKKGRWLLLSRGDIHFYLEKFAKETELDTEVKKDLINMVIIFGFNVLKSEFKYTLENLTKHVTNQDSSKEVADEYVRKINRFTQLISTYGVKPIRKRDIVRAKDILEAIKKVYNLQERDSLGLVDENIVPGVEALISKLKERTIEVIAKFPDHQELQERKEYADSLLAEYEWITDLQTGIQKSINRQQEHINQKSPILRSLLKQFFTFRELQRLRDPKKEQENKAKIADDLETKRKGAKERNESFDPDYTDLESKIKHFEKLALKHLREYETLDELGVFIPLEILPKTESELREKDFLNEYPYRLITKRCEEFEAANGKDSFTADSFKMIVIEAMQNYAPQRTRYALDPVYPNGLVSRAKDCLASFRFVSKENTSTRLDKQTRGLINNYTNLNKSLAEISRGKTENENIEYKLNTDVRLLQNPFNE